MPIMTLAGFLFTSKKVLKIQNSSSIPSFSWSRKRNTASYHIPSKIKAVILEKKLWMHVKKLFQVMPNLKCARHQQTPAT